MKSTGVLRRIDDLGRIVIPKEIRKNLKIRDGESLEIFINGDAIVLKKYSFMSDLNDIAQTCSDSIYDVINKVKGIGFLTIDRIAVKLGINKEDERRIEACILYSMYDLCLTSGNTYSSFNEIYLRCYKHLDK